MSRSPRANGNPFVLTPIEERALAMRRSGMKLGEIAEALGWKRSATTNGTGTTVATAIEKDRLRLLYDARHGDGSSLSKARGRVRMEGTR
jgi:hypothetical protein